MKTKFLLLFSLMISISFAQVKVGDNYENIHSSAVLEAESTDKGFLPPRMTEQQRDAISSPAEGLIVYNLDEKCVNFFDGTEWKSFCGGSTDPGEELICGAYLANGEFKEFMCHNLGADMTLDPFVLDRAMHGDYYQWGKSEALATAYTADGPIPGYWDIPLAEATDWQDDVKGPADPCPDGFRVPTRALWEEIVNNNDIMPTGTFNDSDTNWGAGVKIGNDLLLPAAGIKANGGITVGRGNIARYWSSTNAVPPPNGPGGTGLSGYMEISQMYLFEPIISNVGLNAGNSVRCVKED